jgi:hypothetical protein
MPLTRRKTAHFLCSPFSQSESYVSYNREKLLALVTSLLLKSPIVKHSKKRLQTVHCVIASEAAEFLVKQLSVAKEEAVNLARGLVELGFLKHATNDLKSFVDGNHLYKIKEVSPVSPFLSDVCILVLNRPLTETAKARKGAGEEVRKRTEG